MLLWDVLFRGQPGCSVSFLKEKWSRDFANLFATPLRPTEFVITLIGVGPAAS